MNGNDVFANTWSYMHALMLHWFSKTQHIMALRDITGPHSCLSSLEKWHLRVKRSILYSIPLSTDSWQLWNRYADTPFRISAFSGQECRTGVLEWSTGLERLEWRLEWNAGMETCCRLIGTGHVALMILYPTLVVDLLAHITQWNIVGN